MISFERVFILCCSLFFLFSNAVYGFQISPSKNQAKKHSIIYNKPAQNFFEGALLGNGGLGVVVSTRPDAVVLYFGHNNIWDIRIAENNKDSIGTFKEVFDKVSNISETKAKLIDDPWYENYHKLTTDNYSKPYPRPFPAGSIVLGFDRRKAELIGHRLDISNGMCEVVFLNSNKDTVFLKLFTEMEKDNLWLKLVNEKDEKVTSFFDRVRILPDPSTPKDFPKYSIREKFDEGFMSFKQILPSQEPNVYDVKKGNPMDKAFSLTISSVSPLRKESRINWDGLEEPMNSLEGAFVNKNDLLLCVSVVEGLNEKVQESNYTKPSIKEFDKARLSSEIIWENYWEKSGVFLEDKFLEEIWYRNLYFFNCSAKEGVTAPGLFANWSYNNIGTAWHGDYHMNYNTQQPFWMTFSSNHLEKNLPYVNLVESLMDVSKIWAKEYYELPGAYFPHSAYPVKMTMNPYPVPDWGWEISETPWTVQGLWWHYLYSGDEKFLKERAYNPIKSAVEFLVAYIERPEAKGGKRWKDNKYHIFPTIPPELYSLRPGFKYNYDVNIDLALTKFIFNAFEKMTEVLKTQKSDAKLIGSINKILKNYPDYPITNSKEYGEIFVSVPGEHDKVVYNVPLALSTVFPGEQHGLHSSSDTLKILKNTFRNQQNEGGNDLVFLNLQAARIGELDIERFKRQVNYSLLPNGTATDMVMQVHGRYSDRTDFDFMSKMGIWFENFGLPAVINECLLQSYTGTLRIFPNWPANQDAKFENLRAVGAFLVSAQQIDGKVNYVKIQCEKGGKLKVYSPWGSRGEIRKGEIISKITSDIIEVETKPGEVIFLSI